ncbi:2Fe-2S iron-sulfur cluster-binding protein [Hydrogenophaga sp.]|uniref:2Fe-2S iron-sulfur cluster-binding protein n=1 Tax=Hydrogenophaga sp. TaxID=1904254 RepID=UPI003566CA45
MSGVAHVIRLAGSETRYDNAPGDNLLRAGLRAGLGLPYECNAGGCGSCKFELLSGEVQELWPEAPGLNAKQRSKGHRLACQCLPLSDCEIKIRSGEAFVPAIAPVCFEAEYLGAQQVTVDIREFRFRGPGPARFLPGQYAMLALPGGDQWRAYSMSNQPNEAGEWCFMVRRVPLGRGSAWLFDALQPGQRVRMDGPLGLAHLQPAAERDVVCIAGGSGLAPMVSIANAASAHPRLSGRNIALFYGGRGPADVPAFGDWLAQPTRVRTEVALSVAELADAGGWSGERGFVHELLVRRMAGAWTDHEYYLAGPPPMTEAVVRMLMVDHQVPATHIHYDRFF